MAPKRSSAQIWNGFINHIGISPNIQKQCSVRVRIIPGGQDQLYYDGLSHTRNTSK